MVLIVHTSNFRMRGFAEKPSLAEISAALPPPVVLAVDQGSGTTSEDIPGETRVSTLLKQGAHLVCFSGDKVLGGPQAGIIAGNAALLRVLSAHPLLRAFRPGKSVYSLLEQSLVERLNSAGPGRAETVLALQRKALQVMGRRILKGIPKEKARLVDSKISTGGGSGPDEFFPSLSIEITAGKAENVLRRLRELPTPIIGIIENDSVRLSLATMHGEDEHVITAALRAVTSE
jgi:L-seryl-tRNA(Ser) seleniumtransferase